jgi:hypothetical protein
LARTKLLSDLNLRHMGGLSPPSQGAAEENSKLDEVLLLT